ncbi:MAG: hypothetical protein QGH94_01290 [Phycisphaerae bacterium]|jgi:hypothetical protein|nr:hypothetical protein [Phycisphaerae bacterium]MDP7286604.1 hypothetical protein [Phycisphaerae bacterium]
MKISKTRLIVWGAIVPCLIAGVLIWRLQFAPETASAWKPRRSTPRRSTPGTDAYERETLAHYLSLMRPQLELYRLHHDKYPHGPTNHDFKRQLGGKTRPDGTPDAAGAYGPYTCFCCNRMLNPFNNSSAVLVDSDGTIGPGKVRISGPEACGWYFNPMTGRFTPNTPDHIDIKPRRSF